MRSAVTPTRAIVFYDAGGLGIFGARVQVDERAGVFRAAMAMEYSPHRDWILAEGQPRTGGGRPDLLFILPESPVDLLTATGEQLSELPGPVIVQKPHSGILTEVLLSDVEGMPRDPSTGRIPQRSGHIVGIALGPGCELIVDREVVAETLMPRMRVWRSVFPDALVIFNPRGSSRQHEALCFHTAARSNFAVAT